MRFCLGWASELPVLVRMNDLPEEQRPQSDDPDFGKVWTGEAERDVDWKQISDDWQRLSESETEKDVSDNDTSPNDISFD